LPVFRRRQVDDLITAMVYSVAKEETAKMIAQHTVDETRLGNYNGKFLKIFRKTRATLMDIINDKSVGIIEEDKARNIIKVRVGVWSCVCHNSPRHLGP
jgi:sulfoacetaldehyde dehydrogenase